MRHVSSFSLFESFTEMPSHQELSSLPEWQRMSWCDPEWTTPPDAYAKGDRYFRASLNNSSREFKILTSKGVFVDPEGGNQKSTGLKFHTPEDWNNSLLRINAQLIDRALFPPSAYYRRDWSTRPSIVKILNGSRLTSPDTLYEMVGSLSLKYKLNQGTVQLILILFDPSTFKPFSKMMNKEIKKDLELFDQNHSEIKLLIDAGIFFPSEFTQTLVDAHSWGLR